MASNNPFPKGKDNPRYSGGEITLMCQMCGDSFIRNVMKRKAKYCSISCSTKNLQRPEILKKRVESTTGVIKKPNQNIVGENSKLWKGLGASYIAKHQWLKNRYGNPEKCSDCGKLGEKVKGRWNIQWSNESGMYLRNISDYKGRCINCHRQFDKQKQINVYV